MAKKLTQEEFIERAKAVHGDRYDYSKVEYKTISLQVNILCNKHGPFDQIASDHLKGRGCKTCGNEVNSEAHKLTHNEFMSQLKSIRADKCEVYDYSKTHYVSARDKIIITCKTHGDFKQFPIAHKNNQGCIYCFSERAKVFKVLCIEDVIGRFKAIHGERYDYSNTTYTGYNTNVLVTCKTHGDYPILPANHIAGSGCPKCACVGPSKLEDEVYDFVKSVCTDARQSDRTLIKPLELDIVVPCKSIAVEFNGVYFHSSKFPNTLTKHINKTKACNNVGYRLIHIYEDDWLFKKDIVKKTLLHALNASNETYYARNLSVRSDMQVEAKQFLDANHLQGSTNGNAICLVDDSDVIKAVMLFSIAKSERSNRDKSRYELLRYATVGSVVGGASKLFKYFVRNFSDVQSVISYSDVGTFNGGVYDKLGFTKLHTTRPDYSYVVNNKRVHKSNFKKSEISKKFPEYYDPTLTEHLMMDNIGIHRIYNCGLTKWEWKRP